MNFRRHPFARSGNFRWHELRRDSGVFASFADCAQHCLPSLRACAGLLVGNRAAGDLLMEEFLADIISEMPPSETLATPSGFTAAFEQFLRRTFGDQPQRISLSSGPGRILGVWMSIDEFLDTIAQV